MIKVYFDGNCCLCSKEISHYKRVSPPNIFEWKNIFDCQNELQNIGISLEDALKFLHVVDTEGVVHKGLDSSILIWQNISRWKLLAFLVSLPIFKIVCKFVYTIFAKWRFKHMNYCNLKDKQK